jgi:GcrA cell cycle regulator
MTYPNQTPWTSDRVAELEALRAQGMSTAAIGRRMGITKNAVVGKINRDAMRSRDVKSQLKSKSTPKPKSRSVVPWSYPPHGGCHWPEGDPSDPNFHFCGAPVITPGRLYCEEHVRRASGPKFAKSDAPA